MFRVFLGAPYTFLNVTSTPAGSRLKLLCACSLRTCAFSGALPYGTGLLQTLSEMSRQYFSLWGFPGRRGRRRGGGSVYTVISTESARNKPTFTFRISVFLLDILRVAVRQRKRLKCLSPRSLYSYNSVECITLRLDVSKRVKPLIVITDNQMIYTSWS